MPVPRLIWAGHQCQPVPFSLTSWRTMSGLVVMRLPGNCKFSGCQAGVDEGLQSSGGMSS